MTEETYETLAYGQGVPLVMLHGMMGSPENWRPVFSELPPTCRAVALRFPFFDDGYSFDSVRTVRDYAQGYLEKAGFDKFVVCGNSLGGHVALDLAVNMPGRIIGMVLTGSSGLFERTFGSVVTRPSREWVHEKIREIFYSESHTTDEMVDAVIEVISVRRNVRTLIQIAKSAKRDNVAERLKHITCPALLLWGRQDQVTPPQVAEEFHRCLADSELVWFDRCGHAPMMEYPHDFAVNLGRWWEKYICPTGVSPSVE
jgi:pimeloyl-ACP methyl ester carboxylesterase